jgi:serine/threonine protein kinase/tetratricopeptide (TPR) repeat protein
MKPDRFEQLKEILGEVANLPEDKREVYLDEACKDDQELREEIESILAHESERYEVLKTGGAISLDPVEPAEPPDLPDMVGHTLSHFRLEEKIASGGMGVLYRATDLKLRRQVAIKVLRPDILSHPDSRERFVREARAASALNHAGIVTVYEIDADSGVDFIAMEYVEGHTLDEKIMPDGLSLESITGYVLEVAEALQVAHEKGIVHRDLKPLNIMITEGGKTKILDFGIAKQLYASVADDNGVSPETQITMTGGIIGTLRYLSPEQASGEKVDHRTDLWSLGVTLYEMVTGRLPFTGEGKIEVIGAILKETQKSVSEYRPDLPAMLGEIICKCLEKDKTERYQSAEELAFDLKKLRQVMTTGTTDIWPLEVKRKKGLFARRWSWIAMFAVIAVAATIIIVRNFTPFGDSPTLERKMLVVLPFENLGLSEDEYFADGVTEELTARLASIGELGVIARTSAMKYKGTKKTIRQIGEDLGVDYVLEGTIRWQRTDGGSCVRVTPQLIRVSDEIHMWAEVYEKDLTNIFQVQSEIASQVAENLNITLLGSERDVIEAVPTENPAAYQAYLRGLEYFQRTGELEEDQLMAAKMFLRAIELDPSFALAYAHLSMSHFNTYFWYKDHTEARLSLVNEVAQRALELGPNLPESHIAMGKYYYALRDYNKAIEEFGIASKLRPNDADVLENIALAERRRGNFKVSVESFEKAIDLNPEKVRLLVAVGFTYQSLRDYQTADDYYNRAISLAPDIERAYRNKYWNYILWNGDIKKARETLEGWPGDPEWQNYMLAYVDFFERKYQSALDRLESIKGEVFNTPNYFYPTTQVIAEFYWYMGNEEMSAAYADSARILLETELEERPDDHRISSSLGFVYAFLGLKEDAIRMGETAAEMMPISRDAIAGCQVLYRLTQIYIIVGEHNSVIDLLEYQLSIPSGISIPMLRILPIYDPLRDHPRFQKLIAEGVFRDE